MNLRMIYNSYKERRRLNPTDKFKRQLLTKLEDRMGTYVTYSWYQRFWVKYAVSGIAGFVGVASVATSVYAYNSPSVTEGTVLYPIKKAVEVLEETTKITPEAKAKFYLKKVERREEEKKVIAQKIAAETTTSTPSSAPDVIPALQRTDDAIKDAEDKLQEVTAQLDDHSNDEDLKRIIEKKLKRRNKDVGVAKGFADPTTTVSTTLENVPTTTEQKDDHEDENKNYIKEQNKQKNDQRDRGWRRREWRFQPVTSSPEIQLPLLPPTTTITTSTILRPIWHRPDPIEPIEPPLQPDHEDEHSFHPATSSIGVATSTVSTTNISPLVSTTTTAVSTSTVETTEHNSTTTEKIEIHVEDPPKVEIIEYHNSSSTER